MPYSKVWCKAFSRFHKLGGYFANYLANQVFFRLLATMASDMRIWYVEKNKAKYIINIVQ
ncbi:MAG: hypothetical protein A2622_11005 [Bdellovibrionales bacterium RIFCSPHIGHO2_01_FULL_40_29]|nr:MAG: hypothetical protein A2622_11005 [Bdellovibrionales bacterium RIFCSPHIGHO2_01_FULL_40_29]OFZ34482.1 MAG: hypothetical protein A3D17_01270 [Bdellovibrionales bacterium RIFCSPHIGHO2_02_FULL_40_15]